MNTQALVILIGLTTSIAAGATTQPGAQISISLTTEEGKPLIRALVISVGKPVENATVLFSVRRTFGNLTIGEDKTLDDGTAAVPFPADLRGGADGTLRVVARVKAPDEYASATCETTFSGAARVVSSADPFPRALWAPHAPLPLVAVIVVLMGGVWSVYAYVVGQLLAIRRSARRRC